MNNEATARSTETCTHCGQETDAGSMQEIDTFRRGLFRGCYNCFLKNPDAVEAHLMDLSNQVGRLDLKVRETQALVDLARMGEDETKRTLRVERAMLNFLSMDETSSCQRRMASIETSAGYDCVDVEVCAGNHDFVRRSNIRQCVEELARSLYGENWVDIMIGWGDVQRYTNLEEPAGHNAWIGPETRTATDLADEVKRLKQILQRVLRMRSGMTEILAAAPRPAGQQRLHRPRLSWWNSVCDAIAAELGH